MHEPIRKRADEPLLAVGRRRWRLLVIVASITGTLVVGGGASVPASHAATASGACPPIPASKLRSVLGFDSSLVMRNTVDDSGGVVTYECNTVAWSGPEPASLEAAFQTAKSGHAAQVGIETWTPNDGSPDLQRWLKTDYDELTGRFDIAATLPHFGSKQGWPSKSIKLALAGFGFQRTEMVVQLQGRTKGLVAAIGCWWDDQSSSAACLFAEEAAGKPVVNH